MFDVLLESQRPRSRVLSSSAVASALIHVAVGAIAFVATTSARLSAPPPESFITRALFRPPPDRVPGSAPRGERLQWLTLGTLPGGLDGFTDLPLGQSITGRAALDQLAGVEVGASPDAVDAAPEIFGGDTAFSVLEVDAAAERYADSDAPAYPPSLLQQKLEGSVYIRYFVDTTGTADPRTATVVRSTHPEFTASVLVALGRMRFRAATMGSRRVRQFVEQEFAFRIVPPGTEPVGPPAPSDAAMPHELGASPSGSM